MQYAQLSGGASVAVAATVVSAFCVVCDAVGAKKLSDGSARSARAPLNAVALVSSALT